VSAYSTGLEVDLNLGGTWTPITSYVMNRTAPAAVTITRGRPDETSQVSPSTMTGQLNNRDGRFTARNPTGAYYGDLNRNTPVRLSVPYSGSFMRIEDDSVSLAQASFTAVTGDIDIRMEMWLSNWLPCTLACASLNWALVLNGDGTIGMIVGASADDLYSSTLPVPAGHIAIRVTRAESTGVITFYTSSNGTIGGSWTQLGEAVTGVTGDLGAGSGLIVGYASAYATEVLSPPYGGPNGRFWDFEVYSGIGGTLKAHAAFSSQPAGTITWTDGQGNSWEVSGTATIDDRSYRYHGEMSSLPVAWDPSGHDIWVPFQAGGILRRLQQGTAPIISAMRRAVLQQAGVKAYWACEDGAGAAQIASGLAGAPAMSFSGSPGFQSQAGTPSADSEFACSAQLPQVASSAWRGPVPGYTSSGNDAVTFLLYIPASSVPNGTTILAVTVPGHTLSILYSTASGGELSVQQDGSTISEAPLTGINGVPMIVQLNNITSSTSALVTILAVGDGETETFNGGTSTVSGAFTSVIVNPSGAACGSMEIGHIWVTSDALDLATTMQAALNGHDGETAGTRFGRLCTENGIAPRVYGPPAATAIMGPQQIDTLMNVLQSCEDADRGMLYEPADSFGVGYRTLASLCAQAAAITLNYAAAEVGDQENSPVSLTSVDDDQYTRNDWTLTRTSGSQTGSSCQVTLDDGSAMSISPPPTGVGDYSNQLSVYVQSDAQLPGIAGWMVHTGTCGEERYPRIVTGLHRPAVVAAGIGYTVQDVRIGDFVQVSNTPDWLPPGDIKQLVAGVTETLTSFLFQVSWNAIPESPYETAVAGSTLAASAGSALATSYSSSATSLSVDTPSGELWVTGSGLSIPVLVAGEEMTVTAISGASSPQAFTVTRSVNGVAKAQASGAALALAEPPVAALAGVT